MKFKICLIFLMVLFLVKFCAMDSEIEILDFEYFESLQNEPDKILTDVQSTDPTTQLTAIKELQSLLKDEEYLNEFVQDEHIPILVKCLNSENTTIQIEVIIALLEIAKSSPKNAKEIVRENAIPHFIRLSHSSNTSVAAQSIQVIGVTILTDIKLRNQILKLGLAEHLVEFIEPSIAAEVLNETVRVMLILTLNTDIPLPKETINTLLPAFKTLIRHKNPNVVREITWAFTFLTDEDNSRYNIYLEKNTIKNIVKLINHREPKIQCAAIGVISNVVNSTNDQSNFVVEFDILKMLPKLLMNEDDQTVKYSLSLLTKLFKVSEAQTTLIFDTDIIPLIILHLNQITEIEVEETAAYAIEAATRFANSEQISYMIDMNFSNALCKFLLIAEEGAVEVVKIILIAYDRVFSTAKNRLNELHQNLEKCGGLDAISRLEKHENKKIRKLAYDIVDTYCGKHPQSDF